MRNCLIMGFGRSGTSLMAGILHHAGYFSGNDLYPPRKSNPHGFFENAFVNGINENILKKFDYKNLPMDLPSCSKPHSPYKPGEGHRWLTYIAGDTKIEHCDDMIENNIREAIKVSGYAYKDPRFNYTLGIWNNQIKDDAVYICMFRQPDITVGSVLLECEYADYLSNFYIDLNLAYKLWFNSYFHLFNNISSISGERIVFIHYEQLLDGRILTELANKLGVPIDSSFVIPELNRSKPAGTVPDNVLEMYNGMCKMAGFHYL